MSRPAVWSAAPWQIVRLVLIGGGVIALAAVAWWIRYVLLLAFASVLLAIVLRGIAGLFERLTPLGPRSCLTIATLILAAVIVGFFWLMGAQIRTELAGLIETLPGAVATLGQRFGIENLDQELIEGAESLVSRSGFVSRFVAYTSATLTAVGAAILVSVAGVFMAARGAFYRHGLLLLLPRGARDEGAETLHNIGHALERWILGQVVSMLIIGTVTVAGLYLIGVPSAFALGLLAGIAAFVPLLGPILSFIPAIVVAASESAATALAVLILYLAVQQVESNMIMPLVQRKVVDLPPVLVLFSILALTILFGPLGLLLGAPLTVTFLVIVKQLYVRDALDEPTRLPGQSHD